MSIATSAAHGRAALQVGSPDFIHNDARTNAVDTIANVLHTQMHEEVATVIDMAVWHYDEDRLEAADADADADREYAPTPMHRLGITLRECDELADGEAVDAYVRLSRALHEFLWPTR